MPLYGIDPTNLPTDARFEAPIEQLPSAANASFASEKASLGAALVHKMFGFDLNQVQEDLEADYTNCGDDLMLTGNRPFVALNLVEPGQDGITPGQLVAAYNKVADLNSKPYIAIWEKMYLGRSAQWWNRRNPSGVNMLSAQPLFGAVLLDGLNATSTSWEDQQQQLGKLCRVTDIVAVEGMSPADFLMNDASNIVNGLPRIGGFTRFPQHKRDIPDGGVGCGPSAFVWDDEQACLDGSGGYRDDHAGFRVVLGPKA